MGIVETIADAGRPTKGQVQIRTDRAGQGPAIHEAKEVADEALLHPPVGAILEWPGAAEPVGGKYLFADGRLLEIAEYPELHAVLGNTWNTGLELATQFRIPDRRGRVGVGAGQGTGLTNRALASKFGAETHALTDEQNGKHSHTGYTSEPSHTHTDTYTQVKFTQRDAWDGSYWYAVDAVAKNDIWTGYHTHGHTLQTYNSGNGQAHNNVQPSVGMNFVIRARP